MSERLSSFPDPRAVALGTYLRRTARAFYETAETADLTSVAEAGMVLLDAAELAERWNGGSRGLRILSEAGLFETMPEQQASFVEVDEIRAEVMRGMIGPSAGAVRLLERLLEIAAGLGPAPPDGRSR